jgi:phycocyanobilin lyase beta subunit
MAQEESLDALLFVAQQDEEWVVRYAAVVGLETLAMTIADKYPTWRSEIQVQFNLMGCNDEVLAIRARVWLAQKRLEERLEKKIQEKSQESVQQNHDDNLESQPEITEHKSPLTPDDWQDILDKLYEIKRQERLRA